MRPTKTQISLGSLRCLHEETLGPQLPTECTVKTLIRLRGCAGWSESSLGGHFILLVLSCCGWYSWNIVSSIKTVNIGTDRPRKTEPTRRTDKEGIWWQLRDNYAPNFEEVVGAYWFRVVRASVCPSICSTKTVHARVLKFHIWSPRGKIVDVRFFSCPSCLLFWSYAPLKKSKQNLMHAISYEPCMLGFWNFIYGFLMEKSWPLFFFLSELSPFLELCPFEKIWTKSCQQDISKSIWARGLKHGQLIGDGE